MELVATGHELERLEQNALYLPPSEAFSASPDDLPQQVNNEANPRVVDREEELERLYQKALVALEQRQQEQAKKLLLKLVEVEPNYKDAERYLHLAVTGLEVKEISKGAAQKRIQPTTQKAKPLSVWKPVDHFRLLWWLLVTPTMLYQYEEQFGEDSLHSISRWLVSTLIWLPLFIPTLAFSLSILPGTQLSSPNYMLLNGGIFMAWLLTGWLGHREDNLAVIISVLAAAIVSSSTMFGVTGGLMSAVAGSIALGLALGMAFRLALAIAFSVAGSVASGVALGMVGGVVIGAVSNAALGTARNIASGMTIGVALIIIFILAGSAAPTMNKQSNRTMILGGFMFSLLLVTYIFLIWYSFLAGWQLFM